MARNIEWLVIDVDGTMTDGGLYYDSYGNELKKFNTKDAAGIFAAHRAGIKLIVITGRTCKATEKRMKELQIDYLFQGISDKKEFLIRFLEKHRIKKEEIGYIGDDLNDFYSMQLTGYVGCPADSCAEVKNIADYISYLNGGAGAVRDIIIHILQESGEWNRIIKNIYAGV